MEWLTELWNLTLVTWPLLLSVVLWILVKWSPQPIQRRLPENEIITTTNSKRNFRLSPSISVSRFKSIDDSLIPHNYISHFGSRRRPFNFRRSRLSSVSFGSSDAYFGRSISANYLNRIKHCRNYEDSGHSSLRDSVESLPSSPNVNPELDELRKYAETINQYLRSHSPGLMKNDTLNRQLLKHLNARHQLLILIVIFQVEIC